MQELENRPGAKQGSQTNGQHCQSGERGKVQKLVGPEDNGYGVTWEYGGVYLQTNVTVVTGCSIPQSEHVKSYLQPLLSVSQSSLLVGKLDYGNVQAWWGWG